MAVGASRIYHVNSNCTDLDRSMAFYEALGLRRVVRTRPGAPQPGDAFGLPEVAWDAWMISSDDGLEGILLDLLQWTTPGPTGSPPPTVAQPGLNRICVTTPHLDDVLAAVGPAGGRLVGGPLEAHPGGVRTAMVQDPDGVAVQVLDGDRTTIAQVVVNCTDLDRSVGYYRDVMGLRPVGGARTVDQPAELHGLSSAGTVRTLSLEDGGSSVRVTVVEWRDPAPAPKAPRAANELGLFRVAWSTDDCRRDEGVLRAAGSEPFAATSELSVGDDLPLLRVLFWPGPDGECLELIEVAGDGGATT